MSEQREKVTDALTAIGRGQRKTADDLLPLVYEELRRLARARLARAAPGITLQTTDLVHEAFVRLVDREGSGGDNRGHFFGAAAEAMRRILVERWNGSGRPARRGSSAS